MNLSKTIAALLFIAPALSSCSSGTSSVSGTRKDLCNDSAEAGHYIASLSNSSDDVVRVTDQVIADRKFPLLGDKVVASIGAVVALSRGQKTPDEIAEQLRTTCEQGAGQ